MTQVVLSNHGPKCVDIGGLKLQKLLKTTETESERARRQFTLRPCKNQHLSTQQCASLLLDQVLTIPKRPSTLVRVPYVTACDSS